PGVDGGELRARDELVGERLLVGFQLGLPRTLPDDDLAPDLPRVADELAVVREAVERGAVETVHEEARLLELNREEEGRARVNPLYLAASCVCAAGLDVIDPEGQARRVRFAIEEVGVVLADKEQGVINRIS